MSDYRVTPVGLDNAAIGRYVALLNLCFPQARPFTFDYVKWLYVQNPEGAAVGFDAWAGESLAAHYVTVPVRCRIAGKEHSVLLSLNTATHPDHRGKSLFTKLAQQTYDAAAQAGFSAVIGVANANSTHGFIAKLGFQLVRPLDAYVGIGSPAFDATRAEADAQALVRLWPALSLQWRIVNPRNPLKRHAGGITGKAHLYGLNIISKRPAASLAKTAAAPFWPQLFVGALPVGHNMGLNYIKIPAFLKSSPLNFIYRPLNHVPPVLDANGLFFDFLDFDVF